MAQYETVLAERDGAVGLVTLNRPKALNALNAQLRLSASSPSTAPRRSTPSTPS